VSVIYLYGILPYNLASYRRDLNFRFSNARNFIKNLAEYNTTYLPYFEAFYQARRFRRFVGPGDKNILYLLGSKLTLAVSAVETFCAGSVTWQGLLEG
jgi:hypothetical protein